MRYIQYIVYFLFLSGIALACSDDKLINDTVPPDQNVYLPEEGENVFDICVENMSSRTRAIDFSEGSSVRINTLWLGIFDMSNGNCVESIEAPQDYAFVTSGEIAHGLLRVKFNGPSSGASGNYFMMAVANYQGIYARKAIINGNNVSISEPQLLSDFLAGVENWNDFNSIGIETSSAQAGDHSNDAPLLAGFLNNTDQYQGNINSSTHLRVNQFESQATSSNSSTGKVLNIFPYTLANDNNKVYGALNITWNGASNVKRYVYQANATNLNHTIFFRRLLANVNVRITTSALSGDGDDDYSDLEIMNVSYRRFNLPNYVYIVERSLSDPNVKGSSFPTTALRAYSPNFGDLDFTGLISSDGKEEKGYFNDDDNYVSITPSQGTDVWSEDTHENWISDGAIKDDAGVWNFSFQHFANKHWARKPLNDYEDREKVDSTQVSVGGGTTYIPFFTALADDAYDINNNASYFILKLHMLNYKKNRCSDALYTIHEGYSSDDNGRDYTAPFYSSYKFTSPNDLGWKNIVVNDFSVARNLNYTYNIFVHSFKQISWNIDGIEDVHPHRPDMGGKMWQMIYANETGASSGEYSHDVTYNRNGEYENAIPAGGGVYKDVIKIQNDVPNMSFRLYGYNSVNGNLEGFNYNFPDNSFQWLNGMWPPSVGSQSRYFKDEEAMRAAYDKDMPQINDLLFRTFHILKPDDYEIYKDNIMDYEKELVGKSKDELEQLFKNRPEIKAYDDARMDIVEFIIYVNDEIERGTPLKGHKFTMIVGPRLITAEQVDLTNKRKEDYIRALYITDRNGQKDSDGCSTLVNIFAAVQDPPTR